VLKTLKKKKRSWGSAKKSESTTLVSTDTLEDLGVVPDFSSTPISPKREEKKRKADVLLEKPVITEIPDVPQVERKIEVPESKTPITNTLMIKNFVRPFPTSSLKALLAKHGEIKEFWINSIKSFCYVTFADITEATRTRNEVYGIIWPPHNKGEPLIADFVSPEEKSGALQKQSIQREEKRRKIAPEPQPTSRLDQLFRKTTAKPPIYYLPLTDQQVQEKKAKKEAEREERRRKREEERKKREEDRRQQKPKRKSTSKSPRSRSGDKKNESRSGVGTAQ